jgi:hypothetical protein
MGVAGKEELQLQGLFLLGPRLGITGAKVRDGIVVHHFQKTSVGSVDVFELDMEDQVDEIILHQRPEAVLPVNIVESFCVDSPE